MKTLCQQKKRNLTELEVGKLSLVCLRDFHCDICEFKTEMMMLISLFRIKYSHNAMKLTFPHNSTKTNQIQGCRGGFYCCLVLFEDQSRASLFSSRAGCIPVWVRAEDFAAKNEHEVCLNIIEQHIVYLYVFSEQVYVAHNRKWFSFMCSAYKHTWVFLSPGSQSVSFLRAAGLWMQTSDPPFDVPHLLCHITAI